MPPLQWLLFSCGIVWDTFFFYVVTPPEFNWNAFYFNFTFYVADGMFKICNAIYTRLHVGQVDPFCTITTTVIASDLLIQFQACTLIQPRNQLSNLDLSEVRIRRNTGTGREEMSVAFCNQPYDSLILPPDDALKELVWYGQRMDIVVTNVYICSLRVSQTFFSATIPEKKCKFGFL